MARRNSPDWDTLDFEPEEMEVEPVATLHGDEEAIQEILLENHSFSSSSSSDPGSTSGSSATAGPPELSSSSASLASTLETSTTASSSGSASPTPSPDSGRESAEAAQAVSPSEVAFPVTASLLPLSIPGDEGIGMSVELLRLPQGLAIAPGAVLQRVQEAWRGPALRARQYGPRGFRHRPAAPPAGALSPSPWFSSSLDPVPVPATAGDTFAGVGAASTAAVDDLASIVAAPVENLRAASIAGADDLASLGAASVENPPSTSRSAPSTSPPAAASPGSRASGLLPAPPSDDEHLGAEDVLPEICSLCWEEGYPERDCWSPGCACHDPDEPYPVHSRPDPNEPRYRPL